MEYVDRFGIWHYVSKENLTVSAACAVAKAPADTKTCLFWFEYLSVPITRFDTADVLVQRWRELLSELITDFQVDQAVEQGKAKARYHGLE